MGVSASIHDLVRAALIELGLPAPADIIQTMLMKDGYFVGYKFRYDGGCATLQAGGKTIEFFDERRQFAEDRCHRRRPGRSGVAPTKLCRKE